VAASSFAPTTPTRTPSASRSRGGIVSRSSLGLAVVSMCRPAQCFSFWF
jgi:hypothetical protein